MRDKFPRLKYLGYEYRFKKFPNLWARGYYCGTAGHVSQEQVIRYIMEQDGSTDFNYDILTGNNRDKPEAKIGEWF